MFDNYAVKQRIQETIENNKDLFNPKGESGKLKKVYIGFPKNKNIYAVDTPYLVITNAVNFISAAQFANVANNALTSKDYSVTYMLIVVDKQSDGPTVEKSLDVLLQKITDTLDNNFTLRKSDTTDEKVKASLAGKVKMLGAGQYQGKATDGFEMEFACRIIKSTV